jgi:RimJ/RimL family protein N-acetyltransferase
MHSMPLPIAPQANMRTVLLGEDDAALVQSFYDANPDYFVLFGGQPASPDAALNDLRAFPSQDFSDARKHFIGVVDASGQLLAVADIIENYPAPAVWHLGFFIVATDLHGTGFAKSWLDALEVWIQSQGAQYLRLGVVQVNLRGRRFWEKAGFVPATVRRGVDMGGHVHDVQTMVKPLSRAEMAAYYALAPRDRG